MNEVNLDIDVAKVFRPLLAPARYKAAHGGRSSGKSHFFGGHAVERLLVGQRGLFLREYQTSLAQSAKRLLEMKIEAFKLSRYFEIHKAEIRSVTGGLAVFHGMQAHNADTLKSFEDFDFAYFTEARRISERSLQILRPTLRKPGSELWFDWNPEDPKDPIEFLRDDPPDNAIVVEANWRDNPWITHESLEEMRYDRRRDPDKYAHIWEGKFWTSSEARVFRNWKIGEVDEPQDNGFSGPYGGADWGFAIDPTVLVRAWVHQEERKIYIDREVWKVGCPIVKTPKLFEGIDREGEKKIARKLKIMADSARPETIDHMRREGFNIHPAKKGAGSVEDGIEFLKGYDIIVAPECRHVIDELTHYSWEVDKLTGDPTNKLADKKNHTIDALRYALENVRRAKHEFWVMG